MSPSESLPWPGLMATSLLCITLFMTSEPQVSLCLCLYVCFFSCGTSWSQSHYIAKNNLDYLILLLRLLRAEITGVSHHAQFMCCWGQESWPFACYTSTLPMKLYLSPMGEYCPLAY